MKKHIDLDKLSNIKDSQTAYVLGYLAWAGGRDTAFDKFAIQVLATEKSDLNTIKNLFRVNTKILPKVNNNTNTLSFRLTASSEGLSETLDKWYFSKDSTKEFPTIKSEFQSSFVRGFYERHGYVSPKDMTRFTVPSLEFANGLVKMLKSNSLEATVSTEELESGATVYRVWVSNAQTTKLYNWLYRGVTRQHRRKTNLEKLAQRNKLKVDRRMARVEFLKIQIADLDEDGFSVYQISEELGVARNTVRDYLDFLSLESNVTA
jgi:hypothetical protein